MSKTTNERRTVTAEFRAALDGEERRITGHAAVFNSLSEPLATWHGEVFREKIARGAFAKTIGEADVRALFNHDPNFVLGRNKAGTLALAEDRRGLAVDITPPETDWARDLMRSMRRGDIDQMSFGFEVVKDDFAIDHETNETIRTLKEVRLFDVSVVTYPAYPQTDADVRAALSGAGVDLDRLAYAITRARAGEPLACDDRECVDASLAALRSAITPEPTPPHSDDPEPSAKGHSPWWYAKRLQAIEKHLKSDPI